MLRFLKEKSSIVLPSILFVLSTITHFIFFGYPAQVVFDEVYNGNFVADYSTHLFYFDVHPPLARILVKFFSDAIHAPYNVDWSAIGNTLPWGVILLRLLPMIVGTLLPIVVYFICRYLNFSKLASFSAGMLIILENSLLVQTRFILFDGMILLFGFLAVLLYLIYVKRGKGEALLIGSAIFCAGTFSIKWTGMAFPLLIVIVEWVRLGKFKESVKFTAKYAVIGLLFYLSVFAVHFAYLDHSGPGDTFMTDRFQKTLVGNQYASDASVKPRGFFGKFIELNLEMYTANKTLTATHQYSSKWYTWPFMIRPIFYWQQASVNGIGSYIYLLGNPIIYWLGTLSIFLVLLHVVKNRKKLREHKASLFILIGYIVNFLPFIFIGRVMFLYHYEAALVFSILALVFMIERMKHKKYIFPALLFVCLIAFLYFSPLTYGLPMSDASLASHMWLPTWR